MEGPNEKLPDEAFGVHLFRKISSRNHQEEFIINGETDESITVGDFQRNCISMAIFLKKHTKDGDTIACLCENDWLSALLIVSSLYSGVTIVLVNPAFTLRELMHNFSLSQPKLVFCKKNVVKNVLEIKSKLNFVESIILMGKETETGLTTIFDLIRENNDCDEYVPVSIDQGKTALILSSSGTTGLPKCVMISYTNLLAGSLYARSSRYSSFTSDANQLVLMPLFHIGGLFYTLYNFVFGGKTIFLKKFLPDLFLSTIQRFKVTNTFIVPSLAVFLAKSPLVDDYDVSSLRDVLCGSAPMAQNILNALEKRLKVRIRQVYGLTEAGMVACVDTTNSSKPGSVGCLTPNVKAVIKDPDSNEILLRNCHGELCLKGPSLFKGYKNNPDETDLAFDENGYFLTGDIGYFDDDGHLFIVDRIKDIIKYKSYQVAAIELEGILLTHPAVKDVAVIGIPDKRAGELPCAVVVKQPGGKVTKEELMNYLKGNAAVYKELSGGVQFVDSIPKNANGKIMKNDVRQMMNFKRL